jgi:hypothetical protein
MRMAITDGDAPVCYTSCIASIKLLHRSLRCQNEENYVKFEKTLRNWVVMSQ